MTSYDIRPGPNGRTVYDTVTEAPAEVNGFVEGGLSLDDADDLADLFNRPRAEQLASVSR